MTQQRKTYNTVARSMLTGSDDALISFALDVAARTWAAHASHSPKIKADTRRVYRLLAERALTIKRNRKVNNAETNVETPSNSNVDGRSNERPNNAEAHHTRV